MEGCMDRGWGSVLPGCGGPIALCTDPALHIIPADTDFTVDDLDHDLSNLLYMI